MGIPTAPLSRTAVVQDHSIAEVMFFEDVVEIFHEFNISAMTRKVTDEIHKLVQFLSHKLIKHEVQIVDQPIPPQVPGWFAWDAGRNIITDRLEMLSGLNNPKDQALDWIHHGHRNLCVVQRAVLVKVVVRKVLAKGYLFYSSICIVAWSRPLRTWTDISLFDAPGGFGDSPDFQGPCQVRRTPIAVGTGLPAQYKCGHGSFHV
jgi:hypothetical protein